MDWDEENWIEGTGADQEGAGAEIGAGAEAEAEPAPDESWWEVTYGSTAEGAARAMELDTASRAFAPAVEVDGAKGDGQLAHRKPGPRISLGKSFLQRLPRFSLQVSMQFVLREIRGKKYAKNM